MAKGHHGGTVLQLTVGLLCLGLVVGMISQRIRQHIRDQAQWNALTNDVTRLVPFQNAYVGDASNDYNLSTQLPLGNIAHTIAIQPTHLGLEIRYQKSVGAIGAQTLRASLVYNATADFSLIGNLSSITFVFPGNSFHTTRAQVQSWYGSMPRLANRSSWNREVQQKLSGHRYVRRVFATLFDRSE